MKRQRSSRNNRQQLNRTQLLNKDSQNLAAIADSEKTQERGLKPAIADVVPLRLKSERVYTFERKSSVGSVTPSATLDVFGATNFTLSSLPDSSEFTTLFDQYRIVQVALTFFPLTTGPYASPLITVIDYDDSTTPTSIVQLLEYPTSEMTQAGSLVTRTFNPRAATAVYSGAFTSFAQTMPGQWMDVASPSVQYYGLKWGMPATTGGTTTPVYTIYARYILQCRNVR